MKDDSAQESPGGQRVAHGIGRAGKPLAVGVALLLSIACVVTGATAGTVFALALLLVAMFLLAG
jgi:hypothetical protein